MLKFLRLSIRVHSYATEDVEKVMKAVENILGEVGFSVGKKVLLGYYGDQITVLEYEVSGEQNVAEVFRRVLKSLGVGALGVEEKSSSSGRLHVRVDKQKAYRGFLAEGEVDPIKIEFFYEGDWREIYQWLENT
ncbi:MAG: hypothetical protein NZ919_02915 [Candidatus Caldarchaeum sp.]|nr:hypothetical protein [Candidatus Caldarchaeum sp.]